MIGYIEAPRAWGLTRGMARVVGLNLVEAVTDGWLARRELAEMIDTCGLCAHSHRCTEFLSVTAQTKTLPGFCRNKEQIEALQP